MFKASKDNKVIAISDTDSSFPCLVYDAIANEPDHTTADYVHVDGQFVLTDSAEAVEQRKEEVRAVRNQYLKRTDIYLSVTDIPIDGDDKEQYRLYRQYLRDYPETENWYEQDPLPFAEWNELSGNSGELEQIIDGGD